MTAVIYARYSSDNQREESIEGQIRECTAYKANFFYGECCSFIGWERIDFQYQTFHFFTVCTDGTSAFASYIPVHPTQQKKRYYSREPIEAITAIQA